MPCPSAPTPPGSSRAPDTWFSETTTSAVEYPEERRIQMPVAIVDGSAALIRLPLTRDGPSGWSSVIARPQSTNSLSSTCTPTLGHT